MVKLKSASGGSEGETTKVAGEAFSKHDCCSYTYVISCKMPQTRFNLSIKSSLNTKSSSKKKKEQQPSKYVTFFACKSLHSKEML